MIVVRVPCECLVHHEKNVNRVPQGPYMALRCLFSCFEHLNFSIFPKERTLYHFGGLVFRLYPAGTFSDKDEMTLYRFEVLVLSI